jgi:hypothetical protein
MCTPESIPSVVPTVEAKISQKAPGVSDDTRRRIAVTGQVARGSHDESWLVGPGGLGQIGRIFEHRLDTPLVQGRRHNSDPARCTCGGYIMKGPDGTLHCSLSCGLL